MNRTRQKVQTHHKRTRIHYYEASPDPCRNRNRRLPRSQRSSNHTHPADAATATPYIIGGTQAQSEWIVQLEFQTHTNGHDETFGCTGEQLNDEWVLTARHCIDDVASMNVYQSNDQTRRGTPIAVDTVHAAPSGDIALVHLSQESPLRSYA